MRIVLNLERKEYVIIKFVPNELGTNSPRASKEKFEKHMDNMLDVGSLVLATITLELQKQHEYVVSYEIIQNLKEIFEGQARQERYETSKDLFQCKMSEGTPVGAHVIKMMGYIQTLEKQGFAVNNELVTDVILQSLSDSFKQFILNFNMNDIDKTLPQLLGMLRTAKSNLKKNGSNSIQIFQGYALKTGAFTLNRVPSKSVQKTPHEMWTGKSPNMSFMRIWGCKAYVKHQMSTKLEPKSEKCTFVGYPRETKGYYFYNENKVFVARTRVFLEKEFLTNSGKGRNIELEEVQQQQDIEPEVEEISQEVGENSTDLETQPLRRSTREQHEPERYGFLVTTHGDVLLVDQDEPRTYQEAVASPDSEKWLEAMRSEMDSMSENQVWTLVEPPEGIKPIGCKWVFKKKTDMDGNVQTYKGRLVAKGFRQIHGVDYDETFSLVAMFKSIRILLAVASFHDYEIWQMDVKTAFLNGKLEEDVYMTQPEGFVTPENAGKVCKLQRSIYGLKQASRSWNIHFNEGIQEFGFIRNEDEPCVYKKFSGSIVSFLILYVDDILIIGNDIPNLQSIKNWLSSCFSMKDLGDEAYILGVKIYRDRSRRLLGLSQSTYLDKVLKRFSMEESKSGFLPMRHGISLPKEMCPSTPQEKERMSQIPYASAIGSIMYAMICTRPDLSYALSMTSLYQANPGKGHSTAVKNILKYLRRTKDVFLVYGGEEELRIKGYTDASFQMDKDDSRSQSGFVFCLNEGTVS
ncbi:hypothetical protein V6N11_021694 [Hibiscus sabdariffa]|uniref:Reverse transcriptase Ty1/copia-type domain-containing protein n=1 Tax=Hibiscus sabdariffa TaxID=183260 RepID=A0ABR2TH04_9ROSI